MTAFVLVSIILLIAAGDIGRRVGDVDKAGRLDYWTRNLSAADEARLFRDQAVESGWLYVCLFLTAIVAANLMVVWLGPGITVVNALLFIGLDLTARDKLHDAWRGKRLWIKMAALIATGSVLSWLLNRNAGQVAIASFVAFSCAGIADTIVYAWLGKRAWMLKANGSNVVSAAVDSFVFPALAFGFPLLWPVMLGQLAAKTGGGLVWSALLKSGFWRLKGTWIELRPEPVITLIGTVRNQDFSYTWDSPTWMFVFLTSLLRNSRWRRVEDVKTQHL